MFVRYVNGNIRKNNSEIVCPSGSPPAFWNQIPIPKNTSFPNVFFLLSSEKKVKDVNRKKCVKTAKKYFDQLSCAQALKIWSKLTTVTIMM